MRADLAAVAVLCVGLLMAVPAIAQEYPEGEFSVDPTSGAIGTAVVVTGDFDHDITAVRFQCWYRELGEEALDYALHLDVPSPSFSFQYTIPAELNVRQYTDIPTLPPGGECAFYAEAGHRLATASVPFTVVEGLAAMPSAGLTIGPDGAQAGGLIAALMLAVAGVGLMALAWQAGRARP